jgi:oxygen-independent coproporphyrinogen-3 oxidase
MLNYSVYIHIPFCAHRCAYCDFNTYANQDSLIPDYVEALCNEMSLLAASSGTRLPVHTIFFGGGTPSLLPAESIERILGTLEKNYNLQSDVEISLEANPGSLTYPYLQELRNFGINRLSLGMQSADTWELRLLEREHDFGEVIRCVSWARKAGFSNLNLDLIYGLPDQRIKNWETNLSQAFQHQPDHLSLYALSLEHGTPMQHWVSRGLLSEPDPDRTAEMYEYSMDFLERGGYVQYEISNWAKLSSDGKLMSCRHNLQYWHNLPYLGFGAGAHGYAAGLRVANVLAPAIYIQRCLDFTSGEEPIQFPRSPANGSFIEVDHYSEMGETMMMGLRLTSEGISKSLFLERFGVAIEQVYGKEMDELIANGLLECCGESNDSLRLTRRGRLLGNQVFMRFI